MKRLSQAEILEILRNHAEEEAALQEAQGVTPEKAEAQRRQSLEPERCRQCGDLMAPYIDGGRIRTGCFTCDGEPTTR